jgi:hypothetical protein
LASFFIFPLSVNISFLNVSLSILCLSVCLTHSLLRFRVGLKSPELLPRIKIMNTFFFTDLWNKLECFSIATCFCKYTVCEKGRLIRRWTIL